MASVIIGDVSHKRKETTCARLIRQVRSPLNDAWESLMACRLVSNLRKSPSQNAANTNSPSSQQQHAENVKVVIEDEVPVDVPVEAPSEARSETPVPEDADNSNKEKENAAVELGKDGKPIYRPHAGDENEERGNWSNPAEFIISCIGFAVGLGNVWRFPYICYRNGGGAFLVIYWILSATVGFPIIVLELSIGQFTSQGPLHCWKFAPIIAGVGMSMIAVSFITVIYYDIIITWSAFYMFASFTSQLPWETCDYSSWADFRCEMDRLDCLSGNDRVRGVDGLCYNASAIGFSYPPSSSRAIRLMLSVDQLPERNTTTVLGFWDESRAKDHNVTSLLASAQYFHNYVLGDGDPSFSLYNFGTPKWGLVLCMVLVWVLIYLSLMNGIKSSGKIVYFTCLAPYAVLVIFIVRGATLPGAYDGIMYFLTPDFDRLKQPEVWYAAAGQLFYSLSACWGGMVTLASYNRFHNNIIRDALIVVFADTFTSFIASFAIFSIIGYGAHVLERPVDQVVEAGTGLAFIAYPKVLGQLPGSVGFSIIFFFMCILLGLDSEFNMSETVFTAILDLYPWLRRDFKTKSIAFAVFCCFCFLLGLPFLCPGGPKLLNVFDDYCATWAVLLIGILETTAMCWIYGFRRFINDLKVMMNWLPVLPAQIIAVILWGFVTPGILAFIMFHTWVTFTPRQDEAEEGIGWFLTWFVAIWMPLAAVWTIATGKGSLWQRITAAFRPTSQWGPYLEKFRKEAAEMHSHSSASPEDPQPAPGVVSEPANNKNKPSKKHHHHHKKQNAKLDRIIHKRQRAEMPTGTYLSLSPCSPSSTSTPIGSIELNEWHPGYLNQICEDAEENEQETVIEESSTVWASSVSRIVVEGQWIQEL